MQKEFKARVSIKVFSRFSLRKDNSQTAPPLSLFAQAELIMMLFRWPSGLMSQAFVIP
jgi:hypothetical protein